MTAAARAFDASGRDRDDWLDWLEHIPRERRDVYLLPGYTDPFARAYGDRGVLFAWRDGDLAVAMPLLRRDPPARLRDRIPGYSDLLSPYGYGGPIASAPDDATQELWSAFRAAFHDFCVQTKTLTEFQRLHPLLGSPRSYAGEAGFRPHGQTVWLDLDRSEAEVEAGFRKGHRQSIRQARAAGLRIGESHDVATFHALYIETMTRNGAAPKYLLPLEFFEQTLVSLSDTVLLLAELDGEPLAGALLLRHERRLHYHFAAARRDPRVLGAGAAVLAEAIRWGRARGCRIFHLGGGSGGLLAFKEGFSTMRADFYTYEAVHDLEAYERVCVPGASDAMVPCYRAAAAEL